MSIGQVSNKPSVLAAGPARITSVNDFVLSMDALASSGLPSAELKATFQAKRNELITTKKMVTLDEACRMLDADFKALCAIARADAMESGRPLPTDKALAGKVSKALEQARHDQVSWIRPGSEVRTAPAAEPVGLFAAEPHLKARKAETGTLLQALPGHGGDGWAVKHSDGSIAVYWLKEIEPTKRPKSRRLDAFISRSNGSSGPR